MKNALLLFTCLFAVCFTQQVLALRDPTRPPGYIEPLQGGPIKQLENMPVLTSIMVAASRRIAVLNQQFVREGDIINNYALVSIHKDYVILSSGNNTFTIHLTQDVARTMDDYQ